jgi:capsular exopolysaccharide synthesis family protein
MGEISDALRRAEPLDLLRAKPQHGGESATESSPSPSAPKPPPVLDSQPRVETETRAIERRVHRLKEDPKDLLRPARICLDDPQGHFAQEYRRLAIRLRELAKSRHARSIVITSAQAGEGKTTTACNLAIALSTIDHNSRVVLVDLDLHRASIAPALGIQQIDASVEAVLRGECTLEQATIETDVYRLAILAGSCPAKKPELLLARHTLADMIASLERSFDWVIIDTPPVLATSDTQVILQHAATALLVARAGVSPVRAIRRALDHLPRNKVLAGFLNSSRSRNQNSDYYHDYHRDPDDPESASQAGPEETDEPDVERS